MEYYYCPRLLKLLQYLWVSALLGAVVLAQLGVFICSQKPRERSCVTMPLRGSFFPIFVNRNVRLGIYCGWKRLF